MFDITIVTTCMSRYAQLQQSLPAMLAQGCPVIVVDYSCPDHCGDKLKADNNLRVIRATGHTTFNGGEARNLGGYEVETSWVCFMDVDVVPAPNFIASLDLSAGKRYVLDRTYGSLTGTVTVPTAAFRTIGGYDEIINKYGVSYEDIDFYYRLATCGFVRAFYPDNLLQHIEHGNHTLNYERKNRQISEAINCLYVNVKHDVMLALGCDLDMKTRDALMQTVEAAAILAMRSGGSSIAFDIPENKLSDLSVKRSLQYTISSDMLFKQGWTQQDFDRHLNGQQNGTAG